MKEFLFNSIKIKYQEIGQGDPIILLHGFGGSSYSWRYLIDFFSKKYKFFVFDLKGFGFSDKPIDNNYSVNDQAKIISTFILKNKINNVTLIGNSFGGAVALFTYLQLKKNHIIKNIILIDSTGYKQRLPLFIGSLRVPVLNKIILKTLSDNSKVKMILKKAFFDNKKIPDKTIKEYASYLKTPGAYYSLIKTAQQIIPKNIKTINKKYREIDIPVLIIWGEQDKIIPLKFGQKFNKNIPNSQLVIIPKCGHIPQEEKPQETNKIISKFLSN